MDQNDVCYSFESIKYPDGLLDSVVDATYVLHLTSNGRLSAVSEQLNRIHPTKQVYICHNMGFKKCKKQLNEQSSVIDLVDGVINIFKHAKQNGYNNILLLEDDFIFSEEIRKSTHIQNLDSFFKEKQGDDFIYQLGSAPFISIPYNSHTYRVLGRASHANIYSRACMDRMIEDYDAGSLNDHIDAYIIIHALSNLNLYMYYKPLCYQIFPKTENRANWHKTDSAVDNFLRWGGDTFISVTGLDVKPEPGFSILYFLSKLAGALIILVLVAGLYWSISAVSQSKNVRSVFGVIKRARGRAM